MGTSAARPSSRWPRAGESPTAHCSLCACCVWVCACGCGCVSHSLITARVTWVSLYTLSSGGAGSMDDPFTSVCKKPIPPVGRCRSGHPSSFTASSPSSSSHLSNSFGVTSHYLANSDQIQIKMAQGAKPGESPRTDPSICPACLRPALSLGSCHTLARFPAGPPLIYPSTHPPTHALTPARR